MAIPSAATIPIMGLLLSLSDSPSLGGGTVDSASLGGGTVEDRGVVSSTESVAVVFMSMAGGG